MKNSIKKIVTIYLVLLCWYFRGETLLLDRLSSLKSVSHSLTDSQRHGWYVLFFLLFGRMLYKLYTFFYNVVVVILLISQTFSHIFCLINNVFYIRLSVSFIYFGNYFSLRKDYPCFIKNRSFCLLILSLNQRSAKPFFFVYIVFSVRTRPDCNSLSVN